MEKIINHIFWGDEYHINIDVIEACILKSKYKHKFIIDIQDQNTIDKYIDLFKRLNYKYYELIIEKPLKLKDKLLLYKYWLKHPYFDRQFQLGLLHQSLLCYLYKHQVDNIIIHYEYYYLGIALMNFLSYNCKNYIWVGWGAIPNNTQIGFFSTRLKQYYIERFINVASFIVNLTDVEVNKIRERFPNARPRHIPYVTIVQNLGFERDINNPQLLFGNSCFHLQYYENLLPLVEKYKNLHLTYMCNYGISDVQRYEEFKKRCISIWPNNQVKFWEGRVATKEYERIFQQYSVYICGIERQGGIGASYRALMYGLKLYLNGMTYTYLKKQGYVVHHIDELKEISSLDELFDYSTEDQMKNYSLINSFLEKIYKCEGWEALYSDFLEKYENGQNCNHRF